MSATATNAALYVAAVIPAVLAACAVILFWPGDTTADKETP